MNALYWHLSLLFNLMSSFYLKMLGVEFPSYLCLFCISDKPELKRSAGYVSEVSYLSPAALRRPTFPFNFSLLQKNCIWLEYSYENINRSIYSIFSDELAGSVIVFQRSAVPLRLISFCEIRLIIGITWIISIHGNSSYVFFSFQIDITYFSLLSALSF